MTTQVVNIKYDFEYEVYIGRSSIFGNPFIIGQHGTRRDVILLYKKYFKDRITNDPSFKKEVLSLKGKILGCHCKPLACHGDIIVEYLNDGY